jgi:hypothetical protein
MLTAARCSASISSSNAGRELWVIGESGSRCRPLNSTAATASHRQVIATPPATQSVSRRTADDSACASAVRQSTRNS